MHELGIVLQVVEIATERAEGARVCRLVLEIGRLSTVLPDAVRFCWDVASAGTPLDGAELTIVEAPGIAKCRACACEFVLTHPVGTCACGSIDLEWRSGTHVRIKEMEVV
jgi:hydrogenase nickel incorporation protein HypA/HybF